MVGFERTISADLRLRQNGHWDGSGYEVIITLKKTIIYLKSTFFQLLFIPHNVLFRHLNGINRHSFVSKTKSKTTFVKKIQSPQKLFQKHETKCVMKFKNSCIFLCIMQPLILLHAWHAELTTNGPFLFKMQ